MISAQKKEFIDTWGDLTVTWGASKGMGLVHAALLTSPDPLSANTLIEDLDLSRGCVNMATNMLLELGLAHKVNIEGDRKDYFRAEKNPLSMFKAVLSYRREKELDPLIEVLSKLKATTPNCSESEEFCNTVNGLLNFAMITNHTVDTVMTSDIKWLANEFDRTFQINQ